MSSQRSLSSISYFIPHNLKRNLLRFTLIELLVVIAIIAILAGMLTFPLIYLERNRQPLGLNNIQRIEMCFAGWDMKLNKNQVLAVEKIRLTGK